MPLLEIEQKFTFNLSTLTALLRHPNFSRPTTSRFHDTYYDSRHRLSDAGLWLRKRRHLHPTADIEWEAKRSVQNGSFLRSTFSEIKDLERIRELVRMHFPNCGSSDQSDGFGLDPIASFETERLTLRAEEEDEKRFTVVLDVTDFGHEVGEVEVMAEDKDAEKAHLEIDRFLQKYPWFFDTRSPKGKLTAYFEKFGLPKEEGGG